MSDEFNNAEFNVWIAEQRRSIGLGQLTPYGYFQKLGYTAEYSDRTSDKYNVLSVITKYELTTDGGTLGSSYPEFNNRQVIYHHLLWICKEKMTLRSISYDPFGKGIVATLSNDDVYTTGGLFEKMDEKIRWFNTDNEVAFTSGDEVLTKPCR